MLRQLAKSGGFTGINMYSCFLNNECKVDFDDVIRHIEYICSLCGPEHVAFGSDFDGIESDRSVLDNPQDMEKVLEMLLRLNYSESDVGKIASGNIIRVLSEVLK
jgi:membrane dipeptidase